ncbi:MAG: tRNA (adenosine(37)-N6)-threonylcarbamoyltransferase complex ATPase subunit type 1 TsaE [Erythrobacter sp.]
MNASCALPLPDLSAVEALGARIAAKLEADDVIALEGGLGSGKTTLARAIIAALGYAGEVPSPTFTLLETYDGPAMRIGIVHADFYRLEGPQDLVELGLDDYRNGAALIAEWPGRVGGFAHDPRCLSIALEHTRQSGGSGRIAIVRGAVDWQRRMP